MSLICSYKGTKFFEAKNFLLRQAQKILDLIKNLPAIAHILSGWTLKNTEFKMRNNG